MNPNPKSPLSGKPLDQCDERELDAWCAKLCGHNVSRGFGDKWLYQKPTGAWDELIWNYGTSWAASGPLMERGEWLRHTPEIEFWPDAPAQFWLWWDAKKHRVPVEDGSSLCSAIRTTFIVAAMHALELTATAAQAAEGKASE